MVTATNIGRVEEGRRQSITQSIYNMIHADASGELAHYTRHKLKYRRRPKRKPFPIADRMSIHSRPEQADGKRFGDFEMDLLVDSHNHAILTIVERSTNMLFMTKLAHGKKAEPLAKEVRRLLLPYKKQTHQTVYTKAHQLR